MLERYRTAKSAPYLAHPLDAQRAPVGEPYAFTLPNGLFADDDSDHRLNLSAHGMPAWLKFDPASRTSTGTPTAAGDDSRTG